SNNTIVASHTVSTSPTEDVAQWYAINVSSGTPVLLDQGRVGAGDNTFVAYPAVDINSVGTIGMTFLRAGTDATTDFMSMWVTGRTASDPPGTMETAMEVPSGIGQAIYIGSREGDLSGINVDSDGSFWAANEFANTETANNFANWGT